MARPDAPPIAKLRSHGQAISTFIGLAKGHLIYKIVASAVFLASDIFGDDHMRNTLACICIICFPCVALADNEADILSCREVADEEQRLLCYDAVAVEASDIEAAAVAPVGETGNWLTSSKLNAMDDSSTEIVTLASQDGIGPLGRSPVLYLRCASKQLEVFVAWNDYLASDGGHDSGYKNVTVRFESEEPQNVRWGTSTDSTATFAENPQQFLDRLRKSKRLAVQVVPYNSGPVTAVFDINGLDSASMKLRKECSIE